MRGKGPAALLGVVALVLALAGLFSDNDHRQVELDECSPQAIRTAAAALGWSSVDAYKQHLLTEDGGHNPCKRVKKTVKQSSDEGILEYLTRFIFGGESTDNRSAFVHPDRSLAAEEGGVHTTNAVPSTPHEPSLPATHAPVVEVAKPHVEVENAVQPVRAPLKSEAETAANKDADKVRKIVSVQAAESASDVKEEKKEAKELKALAQQSPTVVTKAVSTLEAEARALGYKVEPSRTLAREANELGYALVPEHKTAQQTAASTQSLVEKPESALQQGDKGVEQQKQQVKLARSDEKRLDEEHVVEEAVKRHLAEKAALADDRVRMEARISEQRASQQASSAIQRYGHIMTFEGHEPQKDDAAVKAEKAQVYTSSTEAQRKDAGEQANKALQGYGALLSFSGHQGDKDDKRDLTALERQKLAEADLERRKAGGKAEKQLRQYNLLSFHDEQIARKELAQARVAIKSTQGDAANSGEDASGARQGVAAAAIKSTQRDAANIGEDASGARQGVAAVGKVGSMPHLMARGQQVPSDAGTGGRGTELQWNGRGIPRF